MPRGWRACSAGLLAFAVYWCFGRLRRVGVRNLQLALPQLSSKARKRILRGVYIHLGWQLVEFCRMTRYTPENTRDWMRTEGWNTTSEAQGPRQGRADHYRAPGRVGAFELLPLADGSPMGMVIRRLDNRRSMSMSTASAACTGIS
jgi:Kdo2-lipid IVA lauroyltransferase/acyltransferase